MHLFGGLSSGPKCDWLETITVLKEFLLVNFIVLLLLKVDHNLITSIVTFIFLSLGTKDFRIMLESLITFIPGSKVFEVNEAPL